MSLYDPLGIATPVTSQANRILQCTWRHNIGWDERLPQNLERKWHEWLTALQSLKSVQLPRCLQGYSSATKLDLHVFVDASELCYATAAYWRSVDDSGNVRVSLAAAKGRVAPLSITSVPRLELQAAVLGGRLARTVEEEHDRRPDRRVFWSDSRTVLAWLRAGARSFKPFVAHRVAELEETTAGAEWRWVPTAHNVADDATRDVPPDFTTTHRWFRGPPFLYDDEGTWPQEHEPLASTVTGEERVSTATATTGPRLVEALPDATRFSSWLRLVRASARVLQFIERCRTHTAAATRKRTRRTTTDDPTWSLIRPNATSAPRNVSTRAAGGTTVGPTAHIPLAAQYTRRAELLWTRALQEECFADELRDVTGGRAVSMSSRLCRLSLIVDEHGVLRLRSRIAAATDVTEETYAPAVLDGDHYYCRLYIDWIHRKLHHNGVECVVNEVRQRYWVVGLQPTVRTVIKCCQLCRLRRAVPPTPRTGNLPPCRLAYHQRAFMHTGVDYFADLFWQRWVCEVLPALQNRREPHGRGEAIKEGDLVVIVDSNLPRNVWPKGRVERTYPGADGVVRVVDVRTKSGVMRRPTKRLIILPVE